MTEKNNPAQSFIPVIASELLNKVQDLKGAGYRLVQVCATKVNNEFQILYSFDKDYQLLNLKMTVNQDEELPSITGVYWSAFIYENEIKDLFGFNFKNLVLDYGGHFIVTSTPTPWNPQAESVGAVIELEDAESEKSGVGDLKPDVKEGRQSGGAVKSSAEAEGQSTGVEKSNAGVIEQSVATLKSSAEASIQGAGAGKEAAKDE